MAGLGQYDTWDTLLPAVFGIATAEFEAGWQTYLARQYGVPSGRATAHLGARPLQITESFVSN